LVAIHNNLSHLNGIISFNLKAKNGSWIGYFAVLKKLGEKNIMLRAGCNCNPGSCAEYLDVDQKVFEKVSSQKEKCIDEIDIYDGYVLGSLRASFGYWTTKQDIDLLIHALQDWAE